MGTAPAPGSWAHLQVLARGHSPCSCFLLTSPAPGPWAYPLLLAHGTFPEHIPTLHTCPRARAKPSHRSSSPKRSQVSSQQRLMGSSPSCLGCHQGAAPPVSPRGVPSPHGDMGPEQGARAAGAAGAAAHTAHQQHLQSASPCRPGEEAGGLRAPGEGHRQGRERERKWRDWVFRRREAERLQQLELVGSPPWGKSLCPA